MVWCFLLNVLLGEHVRLRPVLRIVGRAAGDFEGNTSVQVLGEESTSQQNRGFCDCMTSCTDACWLANTRVGFMWVGAIFAVWILAAMLLVVFTVQEPRRAASGASQ